MAAAEEKKESENKPVFIFLDEGGQVNPKDCFEDKTVEEEITWIKFPLHLEQNLLDYSRAPEDRLIAMEAMMEEICAAAPTGTLPYLMGYGTGAYVGATLFFKKPSVFRGGAFLSGLYRSDFFVGSYRSERAYLNAPVEFLPGLESAEAFRCFLRSKLIFMCGRGNGEENAQRSLEELSRVLEKRSIPAFFDTWGYDVSHTPDWWTKEFRYAVKLLLR